MKPRRIWRNEFDTVSAESFEDAIRLFNETYGFTPEELKRHPYVMPSDEPIPEGSVLKVSFFEGAEGDRDYPAWVDSEPEASVEWHGEGKRRWARVSATARAWAKHEHGLIGSTEY